MDTNARISPFIQVLGFLLSLVIYTCISVLTLIVRALKPNGRVKDRQIPPKCLTDAKYGVHKYANVNGIKLHYVEKGDHSKPLMIFLHGFPEFWYSWRHQLEEFSKDYWCIAIDKRGYGDSDKPKGKKNYKIINVLNDVRELVLSLERKSFTLVGHDWGALLTWEFVHKYGDMLDNFVVMSGPSSDVWVHLTFSEWWQFKHAWYVFFFQGPFIPEMVLRSDDLSIFDKSMLDSNSKVTKDDVEAYKYTFSKNGDFTNPLNYYRSNFLRNVNIERRKKIPRGLMILGEKDAYISQTTCSILKNNYKGFQTEILKGGRHFIQQEHYEEVNEILRKFLEKK